jgi:hypothetical protein
MTATFTPERWAFDITKMLNLVLGPEHLERLLQPQEDGR